MTITIENLGGRRIKARDPSRTVLAHLQEDHIDWMHACGAKGRCTTCRFVVVSGGDNLAALTEAEAKYRDRNALQPNERLACQAKIAGDIVIRVPDECKLPHLAYT